MTDHSNSYNGAEAEISDWAELVVFLSDVKFINTHRLLEWNSIFHKVTILAPATRPVSLGEDFEWISYHKETDTKSDLWNERVRAAEKSWVLFVEDDERIHFNDFPAYHELSAEKWPPAFIYRIDGEKQSQYYQMRFVNKTASSEVFSGVNLPDCTRYITSNNISLSNMPVLIERTAEGPFDHVDADLELSVAEFSPQLYLVEGDKYFKERKYVHAAAQYRQLLKMEKLLPFDRLAGVNGLASCLTEQYKWPQALKLVQKSLEAEPFQNLPYLIEFKIQQLQKNWAGAFQSLEKYLDHINLYSRSNFDLTIGEEETMVNLADLAMKSGDRKKASEILSELFALKNGKVEREFLQKLLLLSVDLEDEVKSGFFFNEMFEALIPDKLDGEHQQELHDYMTMFIENGWYEFVHDVYMDLYHANPTVDEYRRRLIVSSIKTNRVEYARKLAIKVA